VSAGLVGVAGALDVGGATVPDVGGATVPDVGGATVPDVGGATVPDVGGATVPDVGGAEVEASEWLQPVSASALRTPTATMNLTAETYGVPTSVTKPVPNNSFCVCLRTIGAGKLAGSA